VGSSQVRQSLRGPGPARRGREDVQYERALQGYEKAISADNIMTYIPALNKFWGLGCLFKGRADIVKARIMYSKALAGYKKVVGPDHPRSEGCKTYFVL
jgi:hypothetical protein